MPHPPRPLTDYHARLQRVNHYIHDHLDEPLDLMRLAEMAHLSPHHWHRIYAAVFGETMAATVKRLRLERAAAHLAQTTMPIRDIARRSGYPNVQSFTRTFSGAYGLPPAQYRAAGQHVQFQWTQPHYAADSFEVRLLTLDPLDVVGVPHRGSYMHIGKAFDTLYAGLGVRGIAASGLRCVGICYDDPLSRPEAELRSLAAVVPDEAIFRTLVADLSWQQTRIAGGDYAVLRYRGPAAAMSAAYQWLFGYWLPRSGWVAADGPVFEEYLNSPRNTAPANLLTDIHVPVARGQPEAQPQ